MTPARQIRNLVRRRYGAIAQTGCCGPAPVPAAESGCCGPSPVAPSADAVARKMGYTEGELRAAPDGANLGLGCGNPTAIAALRPGEVVVDLGSGAGFDCFLAARAVGPAGRVIGVDMTAEMLERARGNAAKVGLANVEFRLGEIEHLPVADGTADVIISNCVVNLSPDKPAVFREAFRVLKPGGRLAVSDVVAVKPIPAEYATDPELLCSCVGGAAAPADLRRWLEEAGFADVAITIDGKKAELIQDWAPGTGVENYIASAVIDARKPA
jgi:SAM-dependent methyltransferase